MSALWWQIVEKPKKINHANTTHTYSFEPLSLYLCRNFTSIRRCQLFGWFYRAYSVILRILLVFFHIFDILNFAHFN